MTTPIRGSSLVAATAFALLGAPTISWSQQTSLSDAISLRGAGSTFAAPLYTRWIEEYSVGHPNVFISYDVVGSGEGIKRFLSDTIDFAGSDEILDDSDSAKAGGAIMIPVTAGMIVIAYNIPGVTSEIKLPRDVYLDIFADRIHSWDDPRIKSVNPGVAFPHHAIGIVARQDASGTTAAFTRHLDAISPSWRALGMRVGKLIDWPAGTTLASGNEGAAAKIRSVPGSVGYVEFSFAQRSGLRMAALENKAGNFVTPTASAGELALSGRVAEVKRLDASVADPATSAAYPVPSYSWMLLYPHYLDKKKAAALRDFADWILSQQAQDYAAQLGYLALPSDVISLGKRTLTGLTF
jgi:phosphate transport system substrate-binding protein